MGSMELRHLKRVIDFLIFGAVNKRYFPRMKLSFENPIVCTFATIE